MVLRQPCTFPLRPSRRGLTVMWPESWQSALWFLLEWWEMSLLGNHHKAGSYVLGEPPWGSFSFSPGFQWSKGLATSFPAPLMSEYSCRLLCRSVDCTSVAERWLLLCRSTCCRSRQLCVLQWERWCGALTPCCSCFGCLSNKMSLSIWACFLIQTRGHK